MQLKIDALTNGPERRYELTIDHNGHDAKIEISAIQIIRRFPELLEELNIKEQIAHEERVKSGLATGMIPMPRGGGRG